MGELGRAGRGQRDRVRARRSLDRDVVGVGELGLQRLAERGGAGLGLANLAEVLVERNRLVPPQDREAELAVEAPLVGAFERRGDRDGGERPPNALTLALNSRSTTKKKRGDRYSSASQPSDASILATPKSAFSDVFWPACTELGVTAK